MKISEIRVSVWPEKTEAVPIGECHLKFSRFGRTDLLARWLRAEAPAYHWSPALMLMELYFKDLISEDASLEELVDELTLLVQGQNLPPERRRELLERLAQLKQTVTGQAQAADQVVRAHPYVGAGLAFVVGLLAGVLLHRSRKP
jgi:hypothetical protein